MEFATIYFGYDSGIHSRLAFLPVLRNKLNIANFFAHGMAAVGCLTAIICAIFVLFFGPQSISLPSSLPYLAFSVRVDNLSAYFLAIIGLVGGAASIYAMAYGREYYGRRFNTMCGLFLAFLLSMLMVVTVSNMVLFLFVLGS